MNLPLRSLDTLSEAIAMSSPSGRTSKRAHKAACDRLAVALFGDGSCFRAPEMTEAEKIEQERTRLLQHANRLRDLAARGMSVRKFTKEAERAEAEAIALAVQEN